MTGTTDLPTWLVTILAGLGTVFAAALLWAVYRMVRARIARRNMFRLIAADCAARYAARHTPALRPSEDGSTATGAGAGTPDPVPAPVVVPHRLRDTSGVGGQHRAA